MTKKLINGEFSVPSLSNVKVWPNLNPGFEPTSLQELSSVFLINKCTHGRDSLLIHLDRKCVFKSYFQWKCSVKEKRLQNVKLVNFDLIKANTSLLTSARVELFHRCLHNLPLPPDTALGISSTDLSSQLRSPEISTLPEGAEGIRVGPVLGQGGKKEEDKDFSNLMHEVRTVIEQLDDQRCDTDESGGERENRLFTLTSAFIHFSLLGTSITQPLKIDLTNQNSCFVLYNVARMARLLRTFDERVADGTYPPLTEDVDLGLLKESEEWELLFNFLLVYPDMVIDCTRDRSFHKMVSFLSGLASTYSRYYNRVKVLKDPLASLVPQLHARVKFVSEVHDVSCQILRILDIEPLQNM